MIIMSSRRRSETTHVQSLHLISIHISIVTMNLSLSKNIFKILVL